MSGAKSARNEDWQPYEQIVFDNDQEYFAVPVIPIEMEDDPLHTAENGYCCGQDDCWCAPAKQEEEESP